MALKKSELYSSLWKSCDELRGGMDASQYKDYVLVLLFVKYVSDKYAGQPDALIEVPQGGGFSDMAALKGDKEIGEKINVIIGKLAEANELKGVIDVADFNDVDKLGRGQEMVDRLTNLIAIFENPGLDFSHNRAEGDDILGDAYEYLMRHFATESGKSKGQFYTPAEVSRIMAKVIGIKHVKRRDQTIYDPTCGSGSLLLKAADEAGTGVTIYGQEMDNATAALARMNMILHDNPTAEIWRDNTLSSPHWVQTNGDLKTFDFAVANPPFSSKAWTNGFNPAKDLYKRFEDGIPPKKNGDYAFLLHLLRSLKSTGKGAIILPHGVLFRGNTEADIRRNIARKGYIKGIIGLPPNLFYGTGIPACIVVLDKECAANRKGIFIIDASKGFMKDGNKNRLRHQDIHKIVDVFNRQVELPGYSRMVGLAEIEANDYNLNIPRYIDSADPEDFQDIAAHLMGGIPDWDVEELREYWEVLPSLRSILFGPTGRTGYSQLTVEATRIKPVIFEHAEFADFTGKIGALFDSWKNSAATRLKGIETGDRPKDLIEEISEGLLRRFADAPLIDRYDVYQHLMSFWTNTMQDDVYLLVVDGWQATPDLIPPDIIIRRYFAVELDAIDYLEEDKEYVTRQMQELDDEHGEEEGLLFEAKNDKGRLTKTGVKARLKAIMDDPDSADEYQVLSQYLALIDEESKFSKLIKDAYKDLDTKVGLKYGVLSQDEVKTLVVEDKWFMALETMVQSELDRVSQALTGRIRQLAERYAEPLPALVKEVEMLNRKVESLLEKMGYTWQ
ncbi:MAG: type I restriction-modification system subunit M [Anaerolineae bacterium]|nr:type I restriction-modification system subunit M [Anaerolineae bacterium]